MSTVTLTQSWVPSENSYFGVNAAAWTLSCEAFFCALFPVIVVLLFSASVVKRRIVLVGCIATTGVFPGFVES